MHNCNFSGTRLLIFRDTFTVISNILEELKPAVKVSFFYCCFANVSMLLIFEVVYT